MGAFFLPNNSNDLIGGGCWMAGWIANLSHRILARQMVAEPRYSTDSASSFNAIPLTVVGFGVCSVVFLEDDDPSGHCFGSVDNFVRAAVQRDINCDTTGGG